MDKQTFRTDFSSNIFNYKYRHDGAETWAELSSTLIEDVCREFISPSEKEELKNIHTGMQFIAGGRYLYYAGKPNKFFNNCYLLRSEEDTREDWANLSWKAESCLTTGGGIGNDYSIYRGEGEPVKRTGGYASGPISKAKMINEIGREVMQGGSRRSAIYGSLNWLHADANKWLYAKDWYNMPVKGAYDQNGNQMTVGKLKEADFNYKAPLDMTNISLNYDNKFLETIYGLHIEDIMFRNEWGIPMDIKQNLPDTFIKNCRQALKTGEPGFSFNFFKKENETLRNAPVSGETKVLTSRGYKKVIDIVNKEIEIWTGKQWAKTTFKLTKKDSDLVRVNLSNGRTIICSPEHPFIIKNVIGKGKKKVISEKRIAAELLEVNSIIYSHTPTENYKGTEHDYGLGFLIGDGSMNKGHFEISYHIDNKKTSYEKAKYGLNAHHVSIENRSYGKHTYYTTKNQIIDEHPITTNFIAGWFDADGCFTRNLLRLSSSNKDWLYAMQESLNIFGIQSNVRKDGFSSYKPENDSYTLLITSNSLKRFSEIIPTQRLKIELPSDWKPYRDSEIKVMSITKLNYTEDVYCCDVKVEEHSFMAEGVLISNCTEVTSEDDSDVCNLGSINMSRIETIEEFAKACYLGGKFLLCGTMVAKLPYQKVYDVREKNRRLGLGLMGVHEWLLKRGYKYEVVPELHRWLEIYKRESERGANELADKLGISRPVAYRAIAPTGTIGILAGTTTGIEPLFAVAYQRRYLKDGKDWVYQYVVDGTAKILINQFGVEPHKIETALSLADDFERRIKFQADVQDYVDMSISSTINMPKWGTRYNNEQRVEDFAQTLAKYAPRLRGFTCYPDGSRGGQPLTLVDYYEAKDNEGKEFSEQFHDICDISGKGGTCGV